MTFADISNLLIKRGFNEDRAAELSYVFIKLCKKYEFKPGIEMANMYAQMCELGSKEFKKEIDDTDAR